MIKIADMAGEAELERQVAVLKRQLEERDEFLAIVTHELRNPIAPLYMQVAVIEERVRQADAVDRAWLVAELNRLTRRFDHFIASLDRLLDVTRIGERQFELRPVPCNLVEIVRASIATFPEIPRLGIQVTLAGAADVPGVWDQMRLMQLVTNLVSNAIRYGLGKPITLTVDTDERGCARLRVRDQGRGIAEEDRTAIFQRFRRAGDIHHVAGFGVGLWIVQQLCEAMGGSVEVTSAPGEGAEFTVTLPRGT